MKEQFIYLAIYFITLDRQHSGYAVADLEEGVSALQKNASQT